MSVMSYIINVTYFYFVLQDYLPPMNSHDKKSDVICLELPRKDILNGSAELATRCKVSHRVAAAMTAQLVKMGGGSLKDCSVSITSSHRKRKKMIDNATEQIKKDFSFHKPRFLTLHWDGKVIKYEHKREHEERLAIVISYPSDDPNELHHHQFLGAPVLPDSTGISMRNALVQMLDIWDIHNDQIIALSWDTTASNTGHKTGSSTLFEQHLQRSVMWLACRHHIGELHVKHADIKVRGAWNGPSDKLFENFREEFANLPGDRNLRVWSWPEMERPYTFLAAHACDVLNFCQHHLLTESFGRDDYRELCELIIKFLGGQVIRPGQQVDSFQMRAPGAIHHARFMASSLYILKLAMLADVTPPRLLTARKLEGIDKMAEFIALFHGPWFLQARLPSSSPRLDLQLWQHMCYYEAINRDLALEVKASLIRHLWYLTEPLVILGLFDDSLPSEVKNEMATTLRNMPRPLVFPPGKPSFPKARFQQNQDVSLPSLIGPNSWLMFELLGIQHEWLMLPSDDWDQNYEYKKMKDLVSSLSVVNDAAERGVKDVQDYANASRDGNYRERIVLVSNSHRSKIPKFFKNEMEEMM